MFPFVRQDTQEYQEAAQDRENLIIKNHLEKSKKLLMNFDNGQTEGRDRRSTYEKFIKHSDATGEKHSHTTSRSIRESKGALQHSMISHVTVDNHNDLYHKGQNSPYRSNQSHSRFRSIDWNYRPKHFDEEATPGLRSSFPNKMSHIVSPSGLNPKTFDLESYLSVFSSDPKDDEYHLLAQLYQKIQKQERKKQLRERKKSEDETVKQQTPGSNERRQQQIANAITQLSGEKGKKLDNLGGKSHKQRNVGAYNFFSYDDKDPSKTAESMVKTLQTNNQLSSAFNLSKGEIDMIAQAGMKKPLKLPQINISPAYVQGENHTSIQQQQLISLSKVKHRSKQQSDDQVQLMKMLSQMQAPLSTNMIQSIKQTVHTLFENQSPAMQAHGFSASPIRHQNKSPKHATQTTEVKMVEHPVQLSMKVDQGVETETPFQQHMRQTQSNAFNSESAMSNTHYATQSSNLFLPNIQRQSMDKVPTEPSSVKVSLIGSISPGKPVSPGKESPAMFGSSQTKIKHVAIKQFQIPQIGAQAMKIREFSPLRAQHQLGSITPYSQMKQSVKQFATSDVFNGLGPLSKGLMAIGFSPPPHHPPNERPDLVIDTRVSPKPPFYVTGTFGANPDTYIKHKRDVYRENDSRGQTPSQWHRSSTPTSVFGLKQ